MLRIFQHKYRLLTVIAELALFALAGLLAFLLRFEFAVPPSHTVHLKIALILWLPTKTVAFWLCGLNRGWWRYVSIYDLLRVALASLTGSLVAIPLILLFSPPGFPRSIYILDLLLCFLFLAGLRICVRLLHELTRSGGSSCGSRRTLIYGAGDAGVSLLREIRQNPSLSYDVVGFIDDSPQKAGASFLGVRHLGRGEDLPRIAELKNIEMVLIAIPSATGAQMTKILRHCHDAGVKFKTIPGMSEVIEGGSLAAQVRDVAVEDLLGRNPVELNYDDIARKLRGQVVLVTGAGGSIGSELCRQIARFEPRALIGYEIAETALFEIDREIHHSFPTIRFCPEIGSIQDEHRFREVLETYAPSVIFHAAAYKHVPMMENHVFEAVRNNVFGTWNVATLAQRHGVADFVMISSDKAVNPNNVMGATKRLAELLILHLQHSSLPLPGSSSQSTANALSSPSPLSFVPPSNHAARHIASSSSLLLNPASPREHSVPGTATKFVSVRFGNVLGSNGSVIPTFKQQIAAGGPVTVTHPEMRRYFMTIPEATQLVLQAFSMGTGGEIFVLDMGQPVKIVDLARNLILLSGLRPDDDIKIEFTGIRPGEKLYEELNLLDESILPTPHEKIKIFAPNGNSSVDMESWLARLQTVCANRDIGQLIVAIKELVPEYNPSTHILTRALHHPAPSSNTVSLTAGLP